MLEFLPELRKPQHRRGQPASQHIHRDQFTNREVPIHHLACANPQDQRHAKLVHELHRLPRPIGQVHHTKAGIHIARDLFFPAALHARFHRHSLDGFNAAHTFGEKGLIIRAAVKLLVQSTEQDGRNDYGYGDVDRDGQHGYRRQHRAVEQHDPDKDNGE